MNEPDVALRQLRAHHPAGKANHGIVERALFLGVLVIDRHPFPRRRRGKPDRRTPAELQRPVRILFRGRKGHVLVGRGENGRRRPAGRRGWRRRCGRLPWREHGGGQRTEDRLDLAAGERGKEQISLLRFNLLERRLHLVDGNRAKRLHKDRVVGGARRRSLQLLEQRFAEQARRRPLWRACFFAPSLFLKSLLFRRHLSPPYFPRSPPLRRRSSSGERR
jgi:hypothetical protein